MPAGDYGLNVIVNAQTGEAVLAPLSGMEVAARDAAAATSAAQTADNVTRETNLSDAIAEMVAIWNSTTFQTNIKGKTTAEVATWFTGLGAANQAAVVANLIIIARGLMLLAEKYRRVIDPLTEA